MTCRSEDRIADQHPMIVRQRQALQKAHSQLKEAKKYGQKHRQADLERTIKAMRKDLKEAYDHLHKAGWS